jgi:hypothetical protein
MSSIKWGEKGVTLSIVGSSSASEGPPHRMVNAFGCCALGEADENLYRYCDNEPTDQTDPTGQDDRYSLTRKTGEGEIVERNGRLS